MTQSESNVQAPQARRTEVVAPDLLAGRASYDYADAFEIELPEGETRSPEQLFRAALDNASWVQRWVPTVHRHVLRIRLGPMSSPDHILGWRIVSSDADVLHLEAVGPLIRGVIVGRRTPTSTGVFTTFVFYVKRTPARAVWAIVGPLHRRIALYLLERGVATANQTRP
jgi:hypothetical protein